MKKFVFFLVLIVVISMSFALLNSSYFWTASSDFVHWFSRHSEDVKCAVGYSAYFLVCVFALAGLDIM